MRFLRACRVVLAQPCALWSRPVIEIGRGRFREGIFAQPLVQRIQLLVEHLREGQLGLAPPPMSGHGREARSGRVDESLLRAWDSEGFLSLTEGNVIDGNLIRGKLIFRGETFNLTPLTKWNHPRDAPLREAYKMALQARLGVAADMLDPPRLTRSVAVPYKEVWGNDEGQEL